MLKGILSISGQSGLFKLISQTKNGILVESLETKKRMPAHASAKVSALEDIAIFTDEEEVPLKVVFKTIFTKENGGQAIDPKSNNDILKKYFEQILQNYDKNRVYVSDMKKVISWYNSLQKENMLNFDENASSANSEIEDAQILEEVKAE